MLVYDPVLNTFSNSKILIECMINDMVDLAVKIIRNLKDAKLL